MRKLLAWSVLLLLLLSGCGKNLTKKDKIVSLFREHEDTFLACVERWDFSDAEKLRGVISVSVRGEDEEVEFFCGGRGLVPASSYYGILYICGAAGRDYAQVFGASPEWSTDGDGYRYRQANGDNDFYYESLGNGFYYYEEHY